ncbi:unnamed protein product [Nippostrongylus brasiliensis]|uniref:ATP phosphoribosyltransferase n=1 Tax=Nippostrongylus brasiliensis TaxID=27835 RepID=A0A0N4XQL6_NIPBR|nr:unnamed protein product [Nippostrongylus brasiliensis]
MTFSHRGTNSSTTTATTNTPLRPRTASSTCPTEPTQLIAADSGIILTDGRQQSSDELEEFVLFGMTSFRVYSLSMTQE